jgi:hypothetical protein
MNSRVQLWQLSILLLGGSLVEIYLPQKPRENGKVDRGRR